MSGLEMVAIAVNGAVALLIVAVLARGWWLSRHTRRRDAQIDLDDDTAAELREQRAAEWARRTGDDV